MTIVKRPISELNKKEFDQAYEEMVEDSKGKWDRYPLPTKPEILNALLTTGEIVLTKFVELNGK